MRAPYSDQDLIAAVNSVKEEGSGIRYAAIKWNVPFETMRLEGKYGTQRSHPTQLFKAVIEL